MQYKNRSCSITRCYNNTFCTISYISTVASLYNTQLNVFYLFQKLSLQLHVCVFSASLLYAHMSSANHVQKIIVTYTFSCSKKCGRQFLFELKTPKIQNIKHFNLFSYSILRSRSKSINFKPVEGR